MQEDFVYNMKDAHNIYAAYLSLEQDDRHGTYLGLATGALAYATLPRFFKMTYLKPGLAAGLVSVLAYNIYTTRSRRNYARIASEVNRNASEAINKSMNI